MNRKLTVQEWFNIVIVALLFVLIFALFSLNANMGRLETAVNDAAVAAEVEKQTIALTQTEVANAAQTQAAIPTESPTLLPTSTFTQTFTPSPTATFTPSSTPTSTPTLVPTSTFTPTVEVIEKTIITGGNRKVMPYEFVIIQLADGNIVIKEETAFTSGGYDNKQTGIVSITIKHENKYKFWQLPANVESIAITSQGEISYCTECSENTFAGYVRWTDLPADGMVKKVTQLIEAGDLFVGRKQLLTGGTFQITTDPE